MADKKKGFVFQHKACRFAEKYEWQPQTPNFTPKKSKKIEEIPQENSAKVEKLQRKLG